MRADILGFLWSCGFTCDGALSRVAEAACEGDFQQAFEGVTLLEQVESATDEKDLWRPKWWLVKRFKPMPNQTSARFWRRCAFIWPCCMTACIDARTGSVEVS